MKTRIDSRCNADVYALDIVKESDDVEMVNVEDNEECYVHLVDNCVDIFITSCESTANYMIDNGVCVLKYS